MLVRYCTAVALKTHEQVNAFNLVSFFCFCFIYLFCVYYCFCFGTISRWMKMIIKWIDLLSFQSLPIFFPILCFILPWIHFRDSSMITSKKQCNSTAPVTRDINDSSAGYSRVKKNRPNDKKQPKHNRLYERIKFYFTAPITKFFYNMVGT